MMLGYKCYKCEMGISQMNMNTGCFGGGITLGIVLQCKSSWNGVGNGRAAVMSYLHVQLSSRGRALHHSVHHTDQSLALAHLWQTRKEKSRCQWRQCHCSSVWKCVTTNMNQDQGLGLDATSEDTIPKEAHRTDKQDLVLLRTRFKPHTI